MELKEKICNDCGETIKRVNAYEYKRDGVEIKVKAHFRHAKGSNCTKSKEGGEGESDAHKQAKELLVTFLNNNGELSIVKVCKWCARKFRYCNGYALGEDYIAQEEFSLGNSVLDVACYHKENKGVNLCIEVKNTHTTTNIEDRDTIQWYEVDCGEILKNVTEAKKNRVMLTDIREFVCNDVKCKADYNLDELALILGYAQKETKSKNRELYEMAWLGRKEETLFYSIKSKRYASNLEWNKFIKLDKCLFCAETYRACRGFPYCKSCYYEIKTKDGEKTSRSLLEPGQRGKLIRMFDWLRKLPHNDDCVNCDDECSNTWWFPEDHKKEAREGYERGLCQSCFDQECEKRNMK